MILPNELFTNKALDFDADFCSGADVDSFVAAVKDGSAPDAELLQRIAIALEQIELGRDPYKSLGLRKRAANRPKKRMTPMQEMREFCRVQDIAKGKKTLRQSGISRAEYYRLRQKHDKLLSITKALLDAGEKAIRARSFIIKELGLKPTETHGLDLLTYQGVLHLEQIVKNSSVSESKTIKDEIIKLSQ